MPVDLQYTGAKRVGAACVGTEVPAQPGWPALTQSVDVHDDDRAPYRSSHECIRAAEQLAAGGVPARVIDLYSVKPIDTDTLVAAAGATEGRIVVAEDHHPEGGLGSAVAAALQEAGVQQLRLSHLSVSELPGSGTTAELLNAAGIDAAHIAAAAVALVEDSDQAGRRAT